MRHTIFHQVQCVAVLTSTGIANGLRCFEAPAIACCKRYIFTRYSVPIFLKLTITWLTSFFVTSLITVCSRTIILDLNCDPKFKCLCSFNCLFTPIIICTLIFGFSFLLAYWVVAKGHFQQINNSQLYIIAIVGALSGLLIFGYPLTTLIIIYGNYLMIWLPISFVFSLGVIQLAKKHNK